jgi:hypothetical protein
VRSCAAAAGDGTVASALTFGLACVTKFSAVLLLPVFGAADRLHPAVRPRRGPAGAAGSSYPASPCTRAAGGADDLGVLRLPLRRRSPRGCRRRNTSPPPGTGCSSAPAGRDPCDFLRTIGALRLLPEAFLFGYTHAYLGSLARAAYLAGDYSTQGWRSSSRWPSCGNRRPPSSPVSLLACSSPACGGGALRPWLLRLAPLLALAAVYGGVALQSRLNIGHRHLLPLYPALFIVAGVAVARVAAPRPRGPLPAPPGSADCRPSRRVPHRPAFLAYFNTLAGGPDRAWRLLVDSSLDWGQDLRGLKAWLDRHHAGPAAAPVYLSYFGSGEPGYYGMRVRRLPFVNGFKLAAPYEKLEAGLYCRQRHHAACRCTARCAAPWTPALEKEYQEGRLKENLFWKYWNDAATRAEVRTAGAAEAFERTWQRYDLLRFARLCHFLRARRPEAVIGHSIFIHRLSQAEIDAALNGTYSDWLRAVEQAASAR